MDIVTVEWIMSHSPCDDYPEERVRELIGDGLSRQELLRLDIPEADRVWVATQPEFLSHVELQEWLDIVVERAIRRFLGRSWGPAWESWAARWISGEDRTAVAALVAVRAATHREWTAAWAARAAAWAARAAAWAARAVPPWAVSWAAEAAGAAAMEGDAVTAEARTARTAQATAEWARNMERTAQVEDLLSIIVQ